jgi:serine kinase of HPr protein (carbohydrate metabolism regulator)
MTELPLREIFQGARATLGITQITGKSGFMRTVGDIRVQRYVEEDGFWDKLTPGVIIVMTSQGVSELSESSSKTQKKIYHKIISSRIPCIAFAKSDKLNDGMISFSKKHGITLLVSEYDEYCLESRLLGLLREKIGNSISIHGALVNMYGLGVIITGDSGSGKTTCTCELAKRGHAWIADDVIEVEKKGNMLYGRSHNLIKQLIEIKHIGIVDAKDILHDGVILDETTINFFIELKKNKIHMKRQRPEFTAGEMKYIMGVKLPSIRLCGCPCTEILCRDIESAVQKCLKEWRTV